ncbi:MAG: radical SAM protein [Lachnospiraceae bacterium]|nr:radical SAM protein [Lachnospiraceae bacterium]
MDIQDLFYMEAKKGILLINPKNAEMLAVDEQDIEKIIDALENDKKDAMCERFLKPLEESQCCGAEVLACGSIGILPTFQCNFSCTYCFEKDFAKIKMESAMVPAIKEFVKEWDKEFGIDTNIESIDLMGGEILQAKNRQLIEEICKEFEGVEFEVTTNGAELLAFKDLLKKYRVKVTVSLDGTEKMQNLRRKTAVPNAYEKILEGIRFLIAEKIETSIATVMNTGLSVGDYMEFFDMLEELGWLKEERMDVAFSVEMNAGIQGCDVERLKDTIHLYEELLAAERRMWKVSPSIIMGASNVGKILENKLEKNQVNLSRCPANASAGLVFGPDGYVYNCNLVVNEKNRIGQYYPKVEIYRDVVEAYRDRNCSTIAECKDCKFGLFCQGGCPLSAITRSGSIQKGFCGIWKEPEILEKLPYVVDVEHLYEVANRYEA